VVGLAEHVGRRLPDHAELLTKRAALGRNIADRARELGITPVFPGYWGTVPADFATRNEGADVIPQDTWVGYQRPGWLNPATPLFSQSPRTIYGISRSGSWRIDDVQDGSAA
jgi:alpha-N-acetylglucosaminidase